MQCLEGNIVTVTVVNIIIAASGLNVLISVYCQLTGQYLDPFAVFSHRGRLRRFDPAAAGGREHESHRVDAEFAGEADVAGPGHAAELDAGAEQG